MQRRTSENPQSQQDPAQRHKNTLRNVLKLRSPALGYLAAFVFVGLLLLLAKVDTYIPQAPLFLGAPFGLVAILVALIWGIGPALAALLLSLIALSNFSSPGLLTPNVIRDLLTIGPFIVLEIVAIIIVVRLERARRALLHIHQELERTHANVVQSHKQLEQANDLKDYVLTRASHELRTPLTTILGRTQLLVSRLERSGETPENWLSVQKYLGIVEVRALYMSELIDRLFELSQVHSEELPTILPLYDLTSLCYDLIEEVHTYSRRGIEVDLPSTPLTLPANTKRLFQALSNILHNAVKYSEDNTPISFVVETDNDYATIHIHNTCSTLDADQLKQLFQPFYRAPGVEYSSIPGWGLGLTISKEIIERHKGVIWAESLPHEGLSIFVKLARH
ncbi:MAG TPA: HAMP domain-containing sensor histidine kinase [Ktedonobacteraceae bacterium]